MDTFPTQEAAVPAAVCRLHWRRRRRRSKSRSRRRRRLLLGHGTRTGQEVPRAEVRIHMVILRKLTCSL